MLRSELGQGDKDLCRASQKTQEGTVSKERACCVLHWSTRLTTRKSGEHTFATLRLGSLVLAPEVFPAILGSTKTLRGSLLRLAIFCVLGGLGVQVIERQLSIRRDVVDSKECQVIHLGISIVV